MNSATTPAGMTAVSSSQTVQTLQTLQTLQTPQTQQQPMHHSAQHSMQSPAQPEPQDEMNIDLPAIGAQLWRKKWWLLIALLLGAVLSGLIAMLMPNYYNAQVRIMPPGSAGGGSAQAAAMLGALGGLGGGAASALGIKSPGELYVGLLKSRTVADDLIKTFGLKQQYQQATMQGTRMELAALSKIASGKDGIITIDVEDQDPKRAVQLANAYFASLQQMMQRLATTEAGQRRVFFDNQLKQAKNQLTDAEEAFKGMQQKTGVLQLDAVGKVAIESSARIRAAISAKEVEIAMVKQYATPENPDYQRRMAELSALRGELSKQERSQTGGGEGADGKKLSDSGVDYVRKLRDLKYAETMFELMAKQFEFARIDEAKETASLQLIDAAVEPELKSRPKRSLIVVAGTLLAMMLAMAAVLWLTRKQWLKNN